MGLRGYHLTLQGLKKTKEKIRVKEKNIMKSFIDLGKETQSKMKEYVAKSKTRAQAGEPAKLEGAINFVSSHTPAGIEWGVGEISKLDNEAPYWYWINFGIARSGRRIPPGTDENPAIKGHFEPNSGGRFKKGTPRYPMNPKKPITAHNYIEKTAHWLKSNLKKIFRGI